LIMLMLLVHKNNHKQDFSDAHRQSCEPTTSDK
jgi:hypothetical protein